MFSTSIKEIAEGAFHRNQLQEVVFGSGSRLGVVGNYVFGANKLDYRKVQFPENAQVSKNVFVASLVEWLVGLETSDSEFSA